MALTIKRDLIQGKSLLVLLKLVSLPGIVHRSLALFISVLLLSESVAATPGRIGVRIAQQPTAISQDATRAAAERAFQEGKQLYKQGTADSLRQAIAKYEEALSLYRSVGDKAREAVTLNNIGGVYSDLGQKQKALDYYNQSLPLRRAVGEKAGEARTLNNIGGVYSDLGQKQKALDYYNQSLPLFQAVGDKAGEATSLTNIGLVYSDLGQRQKGVEYYNQSLPLFQAVGDKAGEAVTLNNIGSVYWNLGEQHKALDYYNQSLPLARAVGDKAGEARTLNNIGSVYDALGEKQKALDYFNQSLPLERVIGNKAGEATTLNNIGGVYSDLGQKQKALDVLNQSLPLTRVVGDKAGEASTLNNIGRVYSDLGQKQKALDYYNQSLPLRRAVGDKAGEAVTLNNIGLVYSDLGQKQKALDYYNQSLPLARAVGDKAGEALTLNNIGGVYDDLGQKQKSLDYYNQSLPLARAVGDKAGEARTLNNIGGVYSDLGQKQKALDYYNQSLPLRRAVGDKAGEASTLNNIGGVYSDLGQKQKALDYYNQSLPLTRVVGDKAGEASTLNNIGRVYSDLGQRQKGVEYYNQSLPLFQAVGDKAGEAVTLNNIGSVYWNLGEQHKALDYYNQSLPLARAVGDKAGEGRTLNNIGSVYWNLGEQHKALDYFNQSLSLERVIGNKAGEALTLYNLAYLERNRGNLNEAFTQMKTAIEIIEKLRSNVASQQLRASYFATVQDYYQLYIDLLMQLHKTNPNKGYDALALHASERARARSLLELLTEANANIRQGVNPQLLDEERTLQQQLSAAEYNREQLLKGQYTNKQLNEIKQQIETLLTRLQQLEGEIRVNSPRYAALKYPQPLNLQQIQQQVLDDNTLLLEYSLGEERSYLWAVTKTGITSYELPPRADIETVAQEFYKQLKSETGSIEEGMKLSQMLLAPVVNQLGNKRLLIVGDGALQSIPFAALPIPEGTSPPAPLLGGEGSLTPPSLAGKGVGGLGFTPLLVNHEIVSLPSASTIGVLRSELKDRKPAPKTLVAIADPVFSANDDRFKTSQPQPTNATTIPAEVKRSASDIAVNLDRLQYTRKEAQAILALVPENQRFSAFDFTANRTTATLPDLSQYRFIHLATHGLLNTVHPELSGVVLSLFDENGADTDGFLRLNDIFNLNLPAELVVLSACETGLGKDVKGEGLVGLTRGFMYAGAKRVAVSLWSVNDTATASLMTKFYQQMLEKELNPVAALRAAQLEMLKTQAWKAPYYWAAFVVQGEWQ
jgi:CHAT domain-containing protein/tetratricopeptide (TPR) repeat protein